MSLHFRLFRGVIVAAAVAATAAPAQMFFSPPDFSSPPVMPGDPAAGLPLKGATPAELRAALVWNLRAAMNVAALQCQFSPILMTVTNYNQLLRSADKELAGANKTMIGYFTRTAGKGKPGLNAFDVYNTRTYNSFSTLYGQLGFCDTAGRVGRDALGRPRGELYLAAQEQMGELRKSLLPAHDGILSYAIPWYPLDRVLASCRDIKGKRIRGCREPDAVEPQQTATIVEPALAPASAPVADAATAQSAVAPSKLDYQLPGQ